MEQFSLPQDILLLLCQELAARSDFATLFHCSLASRRVASIALEELYSIDELYPDNKLDSSQLWRSIILSSAGKTRYPYCAYVRVLSLGNLEECLEDIRGDKKVRDFLFGGPMEDFLVLREGTRLTKTTRNSRYLPIDIKNTMIKCADSITKYIKAVAENTGTAVALENLEGYFIPHDILPSWITRLGTLTSLRIRDGSVLGVEAASAISESCPNFADLTCYYYQSGTADEDMAAFFQTLRPNTLRSFQILSRNNIGELTLTALNAHAQSLRFLNLSSLPPPAMKSLNVLPNCTALESLVIENDADDPVELKTFSEGMLKEVATWISNCTSLRELHFNHVQDALFILKDVLSTPDIRLATLDIKDFQSATEDDEAAVWTALGLQQQLEHLTLGPMDNFPDGLTLERHPVLTHSIAQLKSLTSLNLMQAFATTLDVASFARALPNLVEFSFSGDFVHNELLEYLTAIPQLKVLVINAPSIFKYDALQNFAQKLVSPGHQGIRVDILNQLGECKFTEHEEQWLENYFVNTLDGRIAITYLNDPDEAHESDFSESD